MCKKNCVLLIKIKLFVYNSTTISSFFHKSLLSFTFLLLFLHFHNVLLRTLYNWVGKSPENFKLAMH